VAVSLCVKQDTVSPRATESGPSGPFSDAATTYRSGGNQPASIPLSRLHRPRRWWFRSV